VAVLKAKGTVEEEEDNASDDEEDGEEADETDSIADTEAAEFWVIVGVGGMLLL
jgi:hypothetical protein